MEIVAQTMETDSEEWYRVHVSNVNLQQEDAQDKAREYLEERLDIDINDWFEEVHDIDTHHEDPDLVINIVIDFQPMSWHR